MKFQRGGLEHHGMILMIAALASNVSGLVYHMVLGGNWGPWKLSESEYQTLVFMTNTILIAVVPMDALRSMAGHYGSLYIQDGDSQSIWAFSRCWLKRLGIFGGLITAIGILMAGPITAYFHVDQPYTWVLTMLAVLLTLFMPFIAGVFQGMQYFYWMSFTHNVWSVLRLILVLVFITFFGPLAVYGVLAHLVGMILCVVCALIGLRWITGGEKSNGVTLPDSGQYLWKSTVILTGFTVLLNADIHLVQLYLPGTGDMAAKAGTIARSLVFLPMPIALAMFPKVSSRKTYSLSNLKILYKALIYVSLLVGSIGMIFVIKPKWPLAIFYLQFDPSEEMISVLRTYVVAMMPLPVCYVLLNYFLAQRRFRSCWSGLAGAILYIVASGLFHDTIQTLIFILGLITFSTCFMMLGEVVHLARKQSRSTQ